MAQLAAGVAGAAIGYFASGGNPYGAMLGWSIGVAAGGYFFPEKANSPKPQEVRVQTAQFGTFKPITWGTVRLPAILVDGSEKLTAHEGDSGGKGGPSAPQPTTYSIDMLDAMWCESRGTHTVLAIFGNGRLIGDYRPGALVSGDLPVVHYNGAADQQPDPTEEAFYGTGLIHAYRGRCRSVYTQWGLSDFGNALPQQEAIVSSNAVHLDGPMATVTYNANLTGHVWPSYALSTASWTSSAPAITAWPEDGTSPIRVRDVAGVVYTYNQTTLDYIGSESVGPGDGWGATVDQDDGCGYLGIGHHIVDDVRLTLWGIARRFRLDGTDPDHLHAGTGPIISTSLPILTSGGGGTNAQYTGSDLLAGSGVDPTDIFNAAICSRDSKMLFLMVTTAAQWAIDNSVTNKWYKIVNGVVTDFGTISGWPEVDFVFTLGSVARLSMLAAMFEDDYTHCWFVNQASPGTVVWKIDSGNVFKRATEHNTMVGDGGLGAPNGQNQLLSVYALASGCKLGVISTINGSAWLVKRCEIQDGTVLLSTIVADLCERSGLTSDQYDVSELTDVVRGFAILSQMSQRAAIEALAPIFYFGYRESAGVIEFVKRGKPSVLTVPDGDLCAHDDNGNDIPSPLQVVKGDDLELPAHIYLKYPDPNLNYQIGSPAQWHRQNTQSTITNAIETAVVLTPSEAKQRVEALALNALNEADKYTFFTQRGGSAVDADNKPVPYVCIEPEDVVTVKGLDLRIVTKNENMATGVLKFEAVRSHPGAFVQTGAGGGVGVGGGDTITEPQATTLVIFDAPYIPDEARQDVLTSVMQGAVRRSWKGAALYKSSDGTNYAQLFTQRSPDTIGIMQTALPSFGGGNVVDVCSRALVKIPPGGGALSSITRAEMFAGGNECLIGTPAIVERCRFMDADLVDSDDTGDTYQLGRFLRDRNGSGAAMRGHAIGDYFAMLPTQNQIDVPHPDYGRTRYYKAPTLGRLLSTADPITVKANGVSRAPLAPVQLGVGFINGGDLKFTWRRRARIHGAWLPFVPNIPLDEETEKYVVRIWEDGTYSTLKRSIIVERYTDFDPGIPYAIYTSDEQDDDFGSPLTVPPAWTVAQYGRLGPGFEAPLGRLPDFVPDDSDGYVPPIDLGDAVQLTASWSSPVRLFSGAMGVNQMLVVQFTTGSVASPIPANLSKIGGAEWTGQRAARIAVLSDVAGDMNWREPKFGPGAANSGYSITLPFCIGGTPGDGRNPGEYYPRLALNTTYYMNAQFMAGSVGSPDWFIDLLPTS